MTRVGIRIDRLAARIPAPRPVPERNLSRLTPQQLVDLERLGARYSAVGLTGMTDAEIDEIAALLGILDEVSPQ